MQADPLPPNMNGHRFANPHGLPLFPLQANSKRPRGGDHGFWRRASPDGDIPPGCNAGVTTGGGLIVIDVDVKGGKNGLATLTGLQVLHDDFPETYTVRTPSGGRHLYFWDPLGRDFGQGTDRLGPGIDVKAHPHGYVVAAGSVIDGQPYKVISETPIADAPAWLIDRLAQSASRSREPIDQTPLVELDTEESIRLATEWLVNEAPEAIQGARGDDTTAKVIAPKLKDFGLSADMAVEVALEHWNDTKATPPWDPGDLEMKIRSGYRSATGNPPGIAIAQLAKNEFPALPEDEIARIERSRPERPEIALSSEASAYSLIPWAELRGDPPPLEWVWDGLIPRGHVTTLFGDGGVGKSLLAQQLATVVAMPAERRGLERDGLFGRRVQPGRVLALFCEDDRNELWRRQERINAGLGLTRRDLGAFGTISGHGHDNTLVTFDRSALGEEREPLKRLREISREFRPSLVIVDNIADTFGGNEITRAQVNRFLKAYLGRFARDQECAVLLLGHPSVAGQNSGTGLSGSTAWNNGVRSRLYMRRLDANDPNPDPDARILEKMKANYGAAGEWMRLRYREGAFDCVLEQSSFAVPADAEEQRATILETMRQLIGRGVNLSPNARAGNYVAKELAKADEIAGLRLSRPQIERNITALLKADEIHIEDYRNRGYDAQRYQIGARKDG